MSTGLQIHPLRLEHNKTCAQLVVSKDKLRNLLLGQVILDANSFSPYDRAFGRVVLGAGEVRRYFHLDTDLYKDPRLLSDARLVCDAIFSDDEKLRIFAIVVCDTSWATDEIQKAAKRLLELNDISIVQLHVLDPDSSVIEARLHAALGNLDSAGLVAIGHDNLRFIASHSPFPQVREHADWRDWHLTINERNRVLMSNPIKA